MRKKFLLVSFLVTFFSSYSFSQQKIKAAGVPPYKPESKEIHDAITRMDSIFFEAYNTCKLDVMESMLSDSLEFYHDRGGLSTSKKEVMEGIKKFVCGNTRRELLKGSIEVYPIPNFGAVQMGAHRFHNLSEKSTSRFSKFVQTWRLENGKWKMYRVISLH